MVDPDELPDFGAGIREPPYERQDEPTLQPEPTAAVNPKLQEKAENVSKKLVCLECSEWYTYNEDWATCPKCGEELAEVDKA